jgi:MraZ protein
LDFFLSHYNARLDAKGRVLIPAPFRNVLARESFPGLGLRLCADAPALDCGGAALMREMERLLAQNPDLTPERDLVATHVLGQSLVLKLDSQGRCVLPEPFRIHAAISRDVVFVGLGHKFQIWEPQLFHERCAAAQTRLRALTDNLAESRLRSFDGDRRESTPAGGCE